MIDFVVTYVDNRDPSWLAEYKKYHQDPGGCRFRDWDLMRYWFRGVNRNAPWVNKIYLVVATATQVPTWLKVEDKVVVITHDQIIPPEYLPTFNSNTIEMFINRIPGLTEKFVYFNDDFYLIRPVEPTRFFEMGRPVDDWSFDHIKPYPEEFPHILLNNNQMMNEVHIPNVSTGFIRPIYPHHYPQGYLKSVADKLLGSDIGMKYIRQTAVNRFRSRFDVNQWILRDNQIIRGDAISTLLTDSIFINLTKDRLGLLDDLLTDESINVAVINDCQGVTDEIYSQMKDKVTETLNTLLPFKSRWEH